MKIDKRQGIYFIIGIAILLMALSNGLRFILPYEVINPYEYFYGSERRDYQIINMFISGAAVTLVSVAAGYLLMTFRRHPLVNIIATLGVILFISLISVVFLFGFETLPAIILMLMIATVFLRTGKKVVLGAFVFLFVLHLAFNGMLILWEGLDSPGDIIYSSIQEMNRFSSVFGGSDYFAVIALNLEVFITHQIGGWHMWLLTIMPWILLGMVLYHFEVFGLFEGNMVMMAIVTAALLAGGLLIKMMEVISLGSFTAANFAAYFGGPLLGTGYFMLLVLFTLILPGRVVSIFSTAGSRGLTVYIAFNLLMAVLSYGVGLGLYGEVALSTMFFIVTGIYAGLIVLMNILAHYEVRALEELSVMNIRNESIGQ